MSKAPRLLMLLLTLSLPVAAAVEVTGVRCYTDQGLTYAVLYLDGRAEIEFSTELSDVRPSLGLIVRDAVVEGAGALAEPVGLAAAGNYEQRGDDTVFFIFPGAGAGSYRVYLAQNPWRAVLEISPADENSGPLELGTSYEPPDRGSLYPPPPDLSGWSRGSVLLVDDDDGPNNGNPFGVDVQEPYIQALDTLGVPYELHVVGHNGAGPSLGTLQRHEVVVYFTGGDAYKVCLSSSDRRNLRAYLDGGGRLLLVSQNYLDQVSSSGTARDGSLAEALGVDSWRGDACTSIALGQPHHELNAGLSLELIGGEYNVGCWSDGLELNPLGEAIFTDRDGGTCGVIVAESGYRSIFLSFAWSNSVVWEEALGCFGRCLEWLAR